MSKKVKKEYATTNTVLITALSINGFLALRISQSANDPNRIEYIYEENKELLAFVARFFSPDYLVDPKMFIPAYKSVVTTLKQFKQSGGL